MEARPVRATVFGKQPQITVDGKIEKFNSQALSLFVYMAENGETEYRRDELVSLLYGRKDAHEAFRKGALFRVPKAVRDLTIKAGSADVMHFFPERVWVDSQDFAQKATSLLQARVGFTKKEYLVTRDILKLYTGPFLQGFDPKAARGTDNARFLSWKEKHQKKLAGLYHHLLEKVIPYCLKQKRNWPEAEAYAEKWLRSPDSGLMPLQYLIWIAANLQRDTLNSYLAQLREREERGEALIGLSSARWNELIRRGRAIPLSILDLEPEQKPQESIVTPAPQLIDRQDTVDEIVMLMTTHSEGRVFAISGLAGVGKTETANAAVDLLVKQHENYTVVRLELTPELDLELLCNSILNQLGKQELFMLDYPKKRRRLRQLLQMPNLVIVVDEGYTSHFADLNTLNTVLELLQGACILLVARQLARFDHYVIELHGFDQQRAIAFLVERIPWLSEVEGAKLEEIAKLTGGLPLLLHIIVGGLKKELTRLHSLIDHLKAQNVHADSEKGVYRIYESILLWFWQYIDSKEKDSLYSISLFASGEGANVDDLITVLAGIFPNKERVQHKVNRLIDLHLVEPKRDPSQEVRYVLHPVILDFIRRQAPQLRRPYVQMIEQAYIRYMLDFVTVYHDQAEQLDKHRQNIVHMFNLAIFSSDHHWAHPQVVEALNQIYPYFERYGLHTTASKFLNQVVNNFEIPSVGAHVEALYYAGKIAYIQGDYENARLLYQEALALIETSNITQHYGRIRQSIGLLQLQNAQLDDAIVSFEAAAHWAKKNDQITLLCGIWSNLAVAAFRQSRLKDAQIYYEMVLKQVGDDPVNLTPNMQDVAQFAQGALGLIYTELGEYDRAKVCYEQSMVLARQLHYSERLGYLYLNLGVMYYQMNDYDAAYDCFVQGGMIAEQIRHPELRTQFLWNQGALASIRFSHKEAFRLLRLALIEADDNDLKWMKPRILIALGKAHLRSEVPDAAQHDFANAWSLPSLSAKHAAQCLYGLALSVMLKEYVVGNNDVETTLDLIQPLLDTLPLPSLPLKDVIDQLEQAQSAFQRDLDHFPHLARFCINEALKIWFSSR